MVQSRSDKQIGYLLRSYPRLSQTFILNEILALEQLGVPIQIFALTNPREELVQIQVGQVRAPVHYLDEAGQPRRAGKMLKENLEVARLYFKGYISALFYVAAHRKIDEGYTASNRWRCFLQAVSLSHALLLSEQRTSKRLNHLHAHFAHDPALIAYLAHCITGIPYSFTAHARDLYQVPEGPLKDRIQKARAVITCCRANLEYLKRIAPSQHHKFLLVYHGVDLNDFHTARIPDVSSHSEPPLILSVGRLVEKKGFDDLLQALFIIKGRGERFQCAIYGEGPLFQQLNQWIQEHGLAGEVMLKGSRTQKELISIFQSASLFIITPFQTDDGDRDGIPNSLLEAMAVGLPVITTAAGGIPELVEHDQNGLLYPPRDIGAISSGIIELLHNAHKRSQLGSAASKKVREQFNITRAANRLRDVFVPAEAVPGID
ncbi:MAG TPA: glycosyltransferase family 4 protein [Anaerolineales bacterium]